ncbi:MAG TPA: tetratricopeptide repeat protein [Pyrinomonadaceae bacterium]|jgi:tetratricopeptide (TPR) repeat protein
MKMNQVELLQKNAAKTTTSERAREACARAKELVESGKFDEARAALSEFWGRIGDRPRVQGLDPATRAEVLLRVGVLSSWLGTARQIPGAQEAAKDLISESSTIFEQLGLTEKVAETRVDLGVCYWREGAHDEARINYDDALQRLGNLESEQRLRALLNKAIVEEVSFRSRDAVKILLESESLFETSSNRSLKSKFHLEFATVLKNLGLADRREDYIDKALMQYTAARVHVEEIGNERVLTLIENNLGFLFAHLERFEDAHEHLDLAMSVASRLNHTGLRATVEDTRARTFLAQGRFEQAEKVARSAVKAFREGDEQSNLAAALTTYATVLAKMERRSDALARLKEAVALASQAGDLETGGLASLTIIEELAPVLSPADLRKHYYSAESALTQSQQPAVRARLGECARSLLSFEAVESTAGSQIPTADMAETDSSLEEKVLRFEGELIKRALLVSDGSVTRAARLLGITHQGLAFILNGRQRDLLSSRKPAKRRRRSIIRFH